MRASGSKTALADKKLNLARIHKNMQILNCE
jgi:hypothetical protein